MPETVEPERPSEQQPVPVKGDVRVGPGGVEYFDGSAWGPYRAVPEPGGGPVFRDHPASSGGSVDG
ncbi:hypothetical protein [Kitasatospora sp. NPDC056181]|uniref:hypothetical protein n=1 Tax=Kitasatospora sp. NPDC056181 TaxID=3345737 RepID=UPI0035D59DB6